MTATSRDQYRNTYQRGISMGSAQGWQRFLQESSRSAEGRAAFQAYREQKKLSTAAPAKIQLLDKLLDAHRHDRMLVFTSDNATAYQIARRFLVPCITHQTRVKERKQILERFHSGEYNVVVTSQVLNEGVDVPAANVGVTLSGTGSVREQCSAWAACSAHGDKRRHCCAGLPRHRREFTSDRRRQHHTRIRTTSLNPIWALTPNEVRDLRFGPIFSRQTISASNGFFQ